MPVTTFVSKTKVHAGFDPVLCRQQLAVLQYFLKAYGATAFSKQFFMILAKEVKRARIATKLIPFEHSLIQRDLQNKKGLRNITVKPRQIGSTTWHIICRLLLPAITEPGTAGLLISQTKGYGAQHFRILQRALKNFARAPLWAQSGAADPRVYSMPDEFAANLLHTQYSARYEILFDFLDSKVLVDTAENPDAGTGLTINHLVCTEVAYWERDPESLLAQAKEAIPAGGTLDIESTPNGMGGYFFEEWQRAKNPGAEFTAHFYPWWWQEDYTSKTPVDEEAVTEEEEKMRKEFDWTLNQIAWRRGKIKSLRQKFPEKYPEDETECVYGNSVVILADGSSRPISSLVSKKYSGRVKTVGKDGNLTTAKVIGWYRSKRNGRKMYRLTYENTTVGGFGENKGVTLTEDHKVLTLDGWERVDNCNGKLVATGTPAPAKRAFQVLIGTILGDSCISNRSLSCSQISGDLIRLKARVLKEFGSKVYSTEGGTFELKSRRYNRSKTFHLNTEATPYFAWLRKKFYPKGIKVVPKDLLEKIDDLGIAVWFMDDGWTNKDQMKQSIGSRYYCGISTGLLKKKEVEWLASLLTSRGYECHYLKGSHGYLRFTCDGSEKLLKVVAKYIPTSLRYKVFPHHEKFDKRAFYPEKTEVFFDSATVKKVKPPTQKNGKYEKGPLYCLDVEGTHNFVTLGGVVHNCFLSGGDLFFDRDALRDIKLRVDSEEPIDTFHQGTLKIYKRRIKGRRYLVAADCAEGKLVATENPDFNAAVVLDIDSGEEVAGYRSRLPPEEYAPDLVALAQMYNDAIIAPERNGAAGASVLLTLNRHLMYGNVYMHREWHRERKMVIPVAGFPTTPRTRPIALNKLAAMVRDAPEFWHDQDFAKEALTFIWATTKKKELFGMRKPQAIPGAHDDTVMCRAVGAYVRLVLLGYMDPVDMPSERYGDYGEPEEEAS